MARNAEQNQKMRDERREQILQSALKLFAMRGLTGTKITHITKEAGISQGLMYHYFRSKEEIFVELLRGALGKMDQAAIGLEKLPWSPKEKLKEALEKMLWNMEQGDSFAHYFMLIAQASISEAIPEEAKAILKKEDKLPHTIIAKLLRQGQEEGSVKDFDAEEMASVFWAVIRGLALQKAAYGEAFKLPSLEILSNIFFV